ncbi:hypothetical protein PIB30_071105, partial [Stylosanthes scabra]|nr:hypothetical protein [Stylosanthes scabra]
GNPSGREIEAYLVSEIREGARIKQHAVQALLASKYNKKIKTKDLEEGDLVLRRADIGGKNGKLGANWEGPYRVVEALGKRRLQTQHHRRWPGSENLAHIQPQEVPHFYFAIIHKDAHKRRTRAFKKNSKVPGNPIRKRHSNNPKGNTRSGRTKLRRSTPD